MLKKTMTKIEIIDQISKDAVIAKVTAKAALESFIKICVKEIKTGRPLRVAGLGTFLLKRVKARKGINPKTGEQIKISIIGMGMRNHAGVAAKMFTTLAYENINIQMINTSEIKISCVIDEKYTELAVRALHQAFRLDKDVTPTAENLV